MATERQALLGSRRPTVPSWPSSSSSTYDQFRSPEIQFAIIQPLEAQYAELEDPSIVYVLLLVRLQFLRERDSVLSSSSLNDSRANLCEILAIKLLRHQATLSKGPNGPLLAMARALVGNLHAFQGAKPDVLDRIKQKEGYASRRMEQGAGKTNALELAILGRARYFIKSQACQRVINAIWEGKIVYTSSSFINILPDRWKIHQINVYNVKTAPILDHYRLRVPKYRSIIENCSFLVLFISFVAVISEFHRRDEDMPVVALTKTEAFFFLYALGYALDRFGSIAEHGWSVYSAGLTNGLDMLAVPIFLVAFVFRVHSVARDNEWANNTAYAILSCAACIMFPRLAFAAISNNLLILSLRAMLAEFAYLMAIAVFCTLGFVFALNHLCDGAYSVARIAEWLIFIWFGLDGSGLDKSTKFHPYLGPAIFTIYAAMTNTLLVGLLVAILSSTYSAIAADAAAEDMFRKAVMTFEGVKADSLFDYVPPLNLLALFVMWPVSKVTSPRWFHKINVAATRVFSLPILLLIALYERQSNANSPLRLWYQRIWVKVAQTLPMAWTHRLSLLEGAHWECEAVFEYTPSGDEKDSSDEDDLEEDTVEAAINDPECQRRVSSRASQVIETAGNRNIGTPPPTLGRNSSFISGMASSSSLPGSQRVSPQPTPLSKSPVTKNIVRFDAPERPPSVSPPPVVRPRARHASMPPQQQKPKERLPANAGNNLKTYGSSSQPRTTGQANHRNHSHHESALSTSPGGSKFESPLSRLYHFYGSSPDESSMLPDARLTGLTGLKRRLSVGRAQTLPPPLEAVGSSSKAVPPRSISGLPEQASPTEDDSAAAATETTELIRSQQKQLEAMTEMIRGLQLSIERLEKQR
ncbi:hypothetical protein OIO90_000811 [Microbotryomycetes sp. JL221]|nr:hypothetical protein OIO90_000811 [Microbotryomycetes sp. JL221]